MLLLENGSHHTLLYDKLCCVRIVNYKDLISDDCEFTSARELSQVTFRGRLKKMAKIQSRLLVTKFFSLYLLISNGKFFIPWDKA